jgi:hypothetical protein
MAQGAVGQLAVEGVEGKGRVFTRKLGKIRNLVHSKPRTHDYLAKAGDLELPLLRLWQHEKYDP